MVTNDRMAYYLSNKMSSFNSAVHRIDTREGSSVTVFDGSREDESKLATQFWNSFVLIPPVESTLVCKEIKQRVRSRTLNDGTTQQKFSTTKSKTKKEKSFRDKIYDESTAIQQAQDEVKRVRAVEQRNEQVRKLFRQQATANRSKNEQWIVPQFVSHPIQTYQQPSTMSFQEEIQQKEKENDHDRQLVCSLPD